MKGFLTKFKDFYVVRTLLLDHLRCTIAACTFIFWVQMIHKLSVDNVIPGVDTYPSYHNLMARKSYSILRLGYNFI